MQMNKYSYITVIKVENGWTITAFNNETCLEEKYVEVDKAEASVRVSILIWEVIS